MSIHLELFSGIVYQIIILNENDIKYRDLLKYIKFESKYRIYDENTSMNFPFEIFIKLKIKLFNKKEKINLDDDICLDTNIINIVFNNKYLLYLHKNYIKELFEFPKNINEQEIESYRLSFIKMRLRGCYFDINKIPEEYITQELCNFAFKHSINSIRTIPQKYRTQEMYKMIQDSIYKRINVKRLFKYLPEEYITQELCDIAVTEDISIYDIPYKYQTKEHFIKFILNNTSNEPIVIPEKLKTDDIFKLIVKNSKYINKDIPEEYYDKEYFINIIETRGAKIINRIPEKYICEEILTKVINDDPKYINKFLHLLTREQLELCYKKYYNFL